MSAIQEILPSAFTIGHSTHEMEELVALLRRHGIEAVADVRAHPSSRRVPQFNRGLLEAALAGAGIEYVHVPELGGRRRPAPSSPNGGWRNEQFRGYADHMASEEFEAGLDRLAALARARPTAAMCAEAQWWRCHRRLLADALVVRGFAVHHIDARGGADRHELTDFAVVDQGRLAYPPAQGALDV